MDISDAVRSLERGLREVFGSRLQSMVVYAAAGGGPQHAATLAVVESLSADDLRACAARVASWHEAGVATPLILEAQEFSRSLDAFPFEFGAILADHAIVSGTDPFVGLAVDTEDLRRACEIQARSHLLHLREGYIETHGRSDAVAELIQRSAVPLAALLATVKRLPGGHVEDPTLGRVVGLAHGVGITSSEARTLFPAYLDALTRLTRYIDLWAPQ